VGIRIIGASAPFLLSAARDEVEMQALVTGATGYIGREVCRQLSAAGIAFVPLSCSGSALPCGRATQALDFSQGEIVDTLFTV